MASTTYSAYVAPQQPGLRSFIVYNEVPDGCVVVRVQNDDAEPHVRAGEFVIVDPSDRDPAEGELFVIQWKSARDGEHAIVDMRRFQIGITDQSGVSCDTTLWLVGGVKPRQPMSLAGTPVGQPIRWADGPYDDNYIRGISQGKIVGILATN